MTTGNIEKPDQKFFFNTHVFDKDGTDLVAAAKNALPPIPVFSEQDMEKARKIAFAEGKAASDRAYIQSHEQRLSLVLEALQKNMAQLFADETLREHLYEREALHLACSIFEQLFPVYHAQFGFEELKAAVGKIIHDYNGKGLIRIYVHSEMVSGLEGFIKTLCENNPDLRTSVSADNSLDVMACRLRWDHGGALRDTHAMASEILSLMQESLAANAAKGHDDSADDNAS
jgi:hypothetical protein